MSSDSPHSNEGAGALIAIMLNARRRPNLDENPFMVPISSLFDAVMRMREHDTLNDTMTRMVIEHSVMKDMKEYCDQIIDKFDATSEKATSCDDSCSICLVDLDDRESDLSGLKCGHYFHKECWYDYLQHMLNSSQKLKCPICRGDFKIAEY